MSIKMILDYLNQKPTIGIFSGFGSGVILSVQSFITDEYILKLVAALGVWLGMLVAALTLVLKCVELGSKVWAKIRIKAKNNDQDF